MGLRHILWTRAQAAGDAKTKHLSFCIIGTRPDKTDVRWCIQDPFPQATCRRIVERLRGEGFDVGEVWRGKPWGAGFYASLPNFEVLFMISGKPGNESFAEYRTMSWCSRPFWKHPDPERVADAWNEVVDKIEKILRDDPQIGNLRREGDA